MTLDTKTYDFAVKLVHEYNNIMWINPKPLRHTQASADDEIHQELIKNPHYLVETNRMFFHMSDKEIKKFSKKLNAERLRLWDDGFNYLDIEILECITHAHKCLRDFNGCFMPELLSEISADYTRAVKTGIKLGLNDSIIQDRAIEIYNQ